MGRKVTLAALAGFAGAALVAGALRADRTLALLAEGYEFIPKRCRHYRSDAFETRLMLTKVLCMTREEAAEVFYEPGRFTPKGALPTRRDANQRRTRNPRNLCYGIENGQDVRSPVAQCG
jgi:hypothetical protein